MRPPLPHGPWLVVGLARCGLAAAALLRARGEAVAGVDAGRAGCRDAGLPACTSGPTASRSSADARAVVKSPGVPPRGAGDRRRPRRGIPVLGELELAWRRCSSAPVVAVTGTNGKTTTARWIGHAHDVAGLPAVVAGNVGTPLSSLAGGEHDPGAVIVCEASSYQLHDTVAFAPEAAVLLNLGSDHLGLARRSGGLPDGQAADLRPPGQRRRRGRAQRPGIEDLGGCARRVLFGEDTGAELSLRSGHLFWDDEPLLRADELALPGAHNTANAMATAAVCLARGMDPDAVREALRTFAGVEHRLEDLGVHDGVRWVNDSKATNVESTLVALAGDAAADPPHPGRRRRQA